MIKRFHQIWLALALALLAGMASAQVVQVKGVGTVPYGRELTPADKDKAMRAAQVSAVERYFAENGESESQNFEAIQPSIEANLDKFILSTTVLNEQDQASMKKYTVAVRIELNVAKMRNTLRAASNAGQNDGRAKSQIVYVFVGRETASAKSFDARVVKKVEATAEQNAKGSVSVKGTEGEKIQRGQISTNASKEVNQSTTVTGSVKMETGGSVTRKADELEFRILSLSNQKTSITSVFSQGGFSVADPEFVLSDRDMKAVNQDYSTGNDLAPSTIRGVVSSLRAAQVPLLALATFDVGAPSQDPATGMQRVAVTVTSRILDVSGGLPREVASVPPVQYFGIGPDNQVAQGKGLKEAALAAAREIVSRLNAVGVR